MMVKILIYGYATGVFSSQLSMRGLIKAQAEWKLAGTALNLRRMAKMLAA